MFNVENAKQINVVWADGTTAIIPCRTWNVDQKKRTLAQYCRYAECMHAYFS